MSKTKNQKRNAKLAERAKFETLCFQVEHYKHLSQFVLPDESKLLDKELDLIKENELSEDFLLLQEIIKGVEQQFKALPDNHRGTFNGSAVAYFLGIAIATPDQEDTSFLLNTTQPIEYPLQTNVYYDNEIRNEIADWLKEKQYKMSTRFGQPIIKLPHIVVEIRRIIA